MLHLYILLIGKLAPFYLTLFFFFFLFLGCGGGVFVFAHT